MPEKKIDVKEDVGAKSKTATKKKAPAKKKTTGAVELVWPHDVGAPGQTDSFYNLECTASKEGVYSVKVETARAEDELNRIQRKKYIKG